MPLGTHRHNKGGKITSGLSLHLPSLSLSSQILLVESCDPLTHLAASISSILTWQLCRDTKLDWWGSVMDVARQESGVLMSFQWLVRRGLMKTCEGKKEKWVQLTRCMEEEIVCTVSMCYTASSYLYAVINACIHILLCSVVQTLMVGCAAEQWDFFYWT